ncbi:hypothetical protein FO519_007369 [Halicephalobus sp. NKZ332]|nr:hypothetical protein FO519_007369 [Halicephalobus sp. NKZ332]
MRNSNLPLFPSDNVHDCLQSPVEEKGIEVDENRIEGGPDFGRRSGGFGLADPLQKMPGILDVQGLSEEGKENRLKRRSSALYLPNFADGNCIKPSLPLREINVELETKPKLQKRSEKVFFENNTGIDGFPSLAFKKHHLVFEVVSIDADKSGRLIFVKEVNGENLFQLKLESFWSHTKLTVGTRMKIIDPRFDKNNVISVTQDQGIIVVEPTVLISSTTLAQGFWCKRKAIFSEKFRSCDTNIALTLGNVCHELFQTALVRRPRIITEAWLLMEFRNNIASKLIFDFVVLEVTPEEFEEQMKPYLKNIMQWMKAHMPSPTGNNKPLSDGSVIADIEDIEANVWSNTIGVKGRIDVVLRRKNDGAIIPFELKTGKSSYSMEHEAQVLMYCLLLSERGSGQIPSGLLLYMKDNKSTPVNPNLVKLKGVLTTRNEMAFFAGKLGIDTFPNPLTETRFCSKCQYATHCSLLQNYNSNNTGISEEMGKFAAERTAHLSQEELLYGKKWIEWTFDEWEANKKKKNMDKIFEDSPTKRETDGSAISYVTLTNCEKKDGGEFWWSFQKMDSSELPLKTLEVGDMAVISTNSFVAIELGIVVDRTKESVTVKCSKKLAEVFSESDRIFHLDKYDSQTMFSNQLNGIVNLMSNTPEAKKVRDIVINENPPKTRKLLKSEVESIKSLVKGLSEIQVKAVVKALMAEDYFLLQGSKDSGKMDTVVAIAKCFIALGKSVLFTGHTNTVVDNMLLKLKEVFPEEKLLRIGGRMEELKSLRLEEKISKYKSWKEVLDSCRPMLMKIPIVVTTFATASSHQFFNWRSKFDLCILDGAASTLQSTVFKPLILASSFIFVDDCRESGSVISCDEKKEKSVSLVEKLVPVAEKVGAYMKLDIFV